MGLNSSYIITTTKDKFEIINKFLIENCNLNESQKSNPITSTDKCLTLNFEVDSSIKRYIRDYYHGRFGGYYQEASLKDRIKNGIVTIGCVDFHYEEFGDKVNLNFVCVTSDMSRLFSDSISIRKWFVKLCQTINAETGIFDNETQFFELFWINNNECRLKVNPEFVYSFKYPENKPSLKPVKDLISAAFDYTYKHKR